ncbi:RNA polymerase sigma-70 factor (ECF subfamily) [Chitinophaga niastensis]|uniref:RNA polymerase sigma-70 factor (ECF subfamily) n=1 Tax=Chitinophaga niastensis TaxID=536980 RepID=A0A2P8HC80_CHINA|nr:sigma-70 family RNA polymerase sigma factor [Chitinophaga niastensis]PSL43845.1 RNA polymerase sigma-70 factor (ECF subfamily) [Chitinophaga niastensis]
MEKQQLIPELYRKEYSKMVTVLCSRLGITFIEAAEDIVSDTFLTAAETWGMKGVPENPAAWLYTVAKNKAINYLKHNRVIEKQLKSDPSHSSDQSFEMEIDLSPQNITDSQLQMMFAICHPLIPPEAQVSLALRILCGFTIDEIASALLTNKGTINKRLFRAKEKLRTGNVKISFPESTAIDARLQTVLITLYLLFNEGYYSASPDKVLRKDFCLEAMRLALLLAEHPQTRKPGVHALLSLMCFQASRFDARITQSGDLVLYEKQDSSLWDTDLINRGNYFFVKASATGEISRYHVEAAIAWWHTHQADTREKWENILRLYNQLLIIEYSPMAALNRAYAFSRVYGKEKAIVEAESLQLSGNLFYHSLLGELFTDIDDAMAIWHLEQALTLVGTQPERAVLTARLSTLMDAMNR